MTLGSFRLSYVISFDWRVPCAINAPLRGAVQAILGRGARALTSVSFPTNQIKTATRVQENQWKRGTAQAFTTRRVVLRSGRAKEEIYLFWKVTKLTDPNNESFL